MPVCRGVPFLKLCRQFLLRSLKVSERRGNRVKRESGGIQIVVILKIQRKPLKNKVLFARDPVAPRLRSFKGDRRGRNFPNFEPSVHIHDGRRTEGG